MSDFSKTLDEINKETSEEINKLLDLPDEYFEDREYTLHQLLLKRQREQYKERMKEIQKRRSSSTIHYEELQRMRRVLGMVQKVLELMLTDDRRCRSIAEQLMAASTILRKIAIYVIKRHSQHCLSKEEFKGTEEERWREAKLSLNLFIKLRNDINAISEIDCWEKERFEDTIKKINKIL